MYQTVNNYNVAGDYSDEKVSAVTSDFDRLFELSWKILKEYMGSCLEIKEAKTGSPRSILKLAFRENLIEEEEIWLQMLKDRNDDTHIYMQSAAILYKSCIETLYLPEIKKLIDRMGKLIPEEELKTVDIPDSLLRYAMDNKIPLSILVRDLCKKYEISEEELFTGWGKQYF